MWGGSLEFMLVNIVDRLDTLGSVGSCVYSKGEMDDMRKMVLKM